MIQEKIHLGGFQGKPAHRGVAGEPQRPDKMTHPLRVLPLALGAVIAVIGASSVASDVLWDLSGHRYLNEVVRDIL